MRCYAVVAQVFPSLVAAMALAIAACRTSPSFDSEAETRAVAQTIDGTIGWAKTKDFERLYGIIADDSAYLEVHPDDGVVIGIAKFREAEAIWASPDFRAIRHDIRDLRISFSRLGNVAWFFCKLDDVNEWKGQPASWINTRWTGVLEKREGRWRMVQMHFSHPVE